MDINLLKTDRNWRRQQSECTFLFRQKKIYIEMVANIKMVAYIKNFTCLSLNLKEAVESLRVVKGIIIPIALEINITFAILLFYL